MKRAGKKMLGPKILDFTYSKAGMNHACDPKCRAAGHIYRHRYNKRIPVVAGARGRVSVPAQEFIRRDGSRELFAVDNPPLIIVNSPKGGKNVARTIRMKRNNKGQFVAARANSPRKTRGRKKGHRKNPPFWTAGAIVNSPKKKRAVSHKRKAQRNPPSMRVPNFLGLPLVMPEVSDVLGIATGLAGPPIVKGFAMQMLPASITTSTVGKWGVEIGSYVLPAVGGYTIGGRRTLKMVFAGQLAGIVVRLVQQAAARITASLPAAGVAGYMNMPGRRALNGYVPPSQSGLNAFAPARGRAMSPRTGARSGRRF